MKKFTPEAQKEIDKYRKTMDKYHENRRALVDAIESGDFVTAQRYLDRLKKFQIPKT